MKRSIAVLAAAGTLISACSGGDGGVSSTSTPTKGSTVINGTTPSNNPGQPGGAPSERLQLSLSAGQQRAQAVTNTPVVSGTPLTPEQVQAVISGLPEWADDGGNEQPFNWPAETPPPPRTGDTIDVPFPPAPGEPPSTPSTEPLAVVRVQPQGGAPIAPFVSITFNQPMVAVGTLEQLAGQPVPATITPELPGTWRWVGTRTLRFDVDPAQGDRLPMATEYTVTVPAGTTSVAGMSLAEAVATTFRTPPPTVIGVAPTGQAVRTSPVVVMTFDQRIDPSAVIANIDVQADGTSVEIRPATDVEIEADDIASQARAAAVDGRWLAFTPTTPLPGDTEITVTVPAGTPSAEGPLTTTDDQVSTMRTFAPLELKGAQCAWGSECFPGSPIRLEFNNGLDAASVSDAAITVTPALPGATVYTEGAFLTISGNTAARTTYTITVPATIRDVYGQTLAEPVTKTVKIGRAQSSITGLGSIITLDPMASTDTLSVYSTGHEQLRVRVFAVTTADFARYQTYLSRRDDPDVQLPAWAELSNEILTVATPEVLTETVVDLGAELGGKPGHVVVLVTTVDDTEPDPNNDNYWRNRPAITWAQSTTIGIDGISDGSQLLVWSTDLTSGAPLAGTSLRSDGDELSTTGDDGVATLALPQDVVVAVRGDDSALLPIERWDLAPTFDELRWYTVSDRNLYRPGETAKLKGWVRRMAFTDDAQLTAVSSKDPVDFTVTDPQGVEIAAGRAELTALGGFEISIDIPESINLGDAYINLSQSGYQHSTSIRVDEFRRPEFEVVTRSETAEPIVSTAPATMAAQAAYYAGGPLPDAPVAWTVSTRDGSYSPPNWPTFNFGVWRPWWFADGMFAGRNASFSDEWCCGPAEPEKVETFAGVTDGQGEHYLQIDFAGDDGALPDLPKTVIAEAAVTDVNRQTWASRTSLIVHPARIYVGIRSERSFVREGETMPVELVVTDIDGAAMAGVDVDLTASRIESVVDNGEWVERETETLSCPVTSAGEPVRCEFRPTVAGEYRVRAVVTDAAGGRSRSELRLWVAGYATAAVRSVNQQDLTMVPDRRNYAGGDVAEVLVRAPFASGEGLLTVTHHRVLETIRFALTDGSAVVKVPIDDAYVPNVEVTAEVVGVQPRTADNGTVLPDAPLQPAFAAGNITLAVPPVSRTLDVTVTPGDDVAVPGQRTTVDVAVLDANGQPVEGAELTVAVVDESLLALTGYRWGDPIDTFYAPVYSWLNSVYARSSVQLADPMKFADPSGEPPAGTADTAPANAGEATRKAPAGDGAERYSVDRATEATSSAASPAPDLRTNFDALALWDAEVTTAADGTARIDVDLADSLTRYRVMVVAAHGTERFGSAEASITARLPLMVRPSAPPFANFGDSFELPVVLQNQTDEPMVVDVVLQAANLEVAASIDQGDTAGQQVTVPANDRVEVRFPVVTNEAGTAEVRVAARSADAADAAQISLPVYTPATTEAFATYGTIDANGDVVAIGQPLLAPTGVVPQFGELQVSTSSTALQALTDSLLYVREYQWATTDAAASQIMTIAALRDVLDEFGTLNLSDAQIDAELRAAVNDLRTLQRNDGGWGFWKRDTRSDPFASIQATHALLLARQAGISVPQSTLDMALAYLADIESHFEPGISDEQRDTLSAYALHVRMVAGDRDTDKAAELFTARGEVMALDALGWLWPVTDGVDEQVLRRLDNAAIDTAAGVHFTTGYSDANNVTLQSDTRTDAIILDALIALSPDSDLIAKVVNGLLASKTRTTGRWDNVQENTFVLLAMHRYFTTFENVTPDFVSKVWLGERFAGSYTFDGRTTTSATINVPTAQLIEAGDTTLVVANDGSGRLYYRIGLTYAPNDLRLDPLDAGFIVDRVYEAIDDPGDVRRNADGSWAIKAGARVRVRLTMVAESERSHVMLSDPLPAGLEILNPELATTAAVPLDDGDGSPSSDSWWWGNWYSQVNMRDQRAEVYAQWVNGGTFTYSYVARATTPGVFVAPPTRAEEMYAPETFGRAASDIVSVVD